MLLRHYGHVVETASDGLEAVKLAERGKPDVILLDVGLPGLDGYEACRRIREQPWGKQMYIVALTGWGQDEDRRKTREAGFDDHLVKPVEFKSIQALLSKVHAA
jgi:CheY-like chemotaxis protein